MARPKGTTKIKGYKTSPGRPRKNTSFLRKVAIGARRFLESPFKRRK